MSQPRLFIRHPRGDVAEDLGAEAERVGVIDAGSNTASVLFPGRPYYRDCHSRHYISEHAYAMRPMANNTMIGRREANG